MKVSWYFSLFYNTSTMVEIKAYQVRYIGLVHILMYVSETNHDDFKIFCHIETLMYIFYMAIAFYDKFSLL